MRILIMLLLIALVITPVCKGVEQPAAHRFTSSEIALVNPDSLKTLESPLKGKAPIVADTSKMKTGTIKDKVNSPTQKDSSKTAVKSAYISPDKGIGPIKELKLGPIDTSMVSKGREIFQTVCVTCHQLDKKKIGPPLRNVTIERPPEFIMNMILNTEEMEKKDPEVKKLFDQYGVYMSIPVYNKDQARQILEFLRWEATQPPVKK